MTSEQQKERIREFILAFDRMDLDALSGMIAPGFEMEIICSAPEFPRKFDRTGLLVTLPKMMEQLFPNGFNYTCGEALADGINASMQGTCDTVTGSGKRYANQYHWHFHFTGDKIDLFREYMDCYATLQAMG